MYLPGWLVVGGVLSLVFPQSPPGYFILLNLLTGLALSSYSILASSLFRRAQLSAISTLIAALVFALVAQFAFLDFASNSARGVLATAILFPPSAYVFFLVSTAGFEETGNALQLNTPVASQANLLSPPAWSIPAATYLGLLVVQTFLFPFLGAVIEKSLHWRLSCARKLKDSSDMLGAAVRLRGFTKHFKDLKDKKKTVKAVDDLSLDLHAGSITVLLGANGSGKSTALNAIAGLETITKGSIELDGTGGLGLCPQKNVMWEDLTVEEHIGIFEALKTTSHKTSQDRNSEVSRMIKACGLEIKQSAKIKTLSGGQKRRAQLGMCMISFPKDSGHQLFTLCQG